MRPLVRLVFYHFGGDFKAFQHATPFGLRWSARSGFAFALAEALFHGAFDLAVCRLFGDLTALVVLTLAACDGELELDDAVLGVELEWDEGLTLLLALADEAVDLLPVQQKLAVAGGELSFLSGVRVRRDVRPDQEDFAVPHPGIALLEVGPALPDGLYLGPRQLDAGFIGLLDGKVVEGLLVSREVCHNRFTTLSSARCMSGRTSSNSTRTPSPTLYEAPMASLERTTPFGSSSHHPGSLLTWTRPVAPVSSSTKSPKAAVLTTVPSRISPTRSRISHISVYSSDVRSQIMGRYSFFLKDTATTE